MPAGPIGSCWAPGTWADTAWEAGSWADAVESVPTPEPPVLSSGGFFRRPFRALPERPPDVRLSVDLELQPFEFRAELHVIPGDVQMRTRLLLSAPEFSSETTMQPANTRMSTLIDLKALAMSAQLKALTRKRDS